MKMTASLKRVFGSPLPRFMVLGFLIFALFGLLDSSPVEVSVGEITIDKAQARRLSAQFEATWRRRPTPTELDSLMTDWIIEEALVREALRLGLDRGDAVIRQRLRQKMTFFAESTVPEADERALRLHYEAVGDRFATPARIAFEQVFLGPDTSPIEEAGSIRDALESGGDPATLGMPTLLPHSMRLAPKSVIDSTYGRGFFDRLAVLQPDTWEGPVPSALGLHLVRVSQSEPALMPSFEALRERVESDWRATSAEAQRKAFIEALLTRYRIERPSPEAVLGQ